MQQPCLRSGSRAPTARNMIATGKREAQRSASPLVCNTSQLMRPEGPKYHAPSGLRGIFDLLTRGDARRFASRLPLAVISRAFGASFEFLLLALLVFTVSASTKAQFKPTDYARTE